jgi:AcrR family transcriptional regulator
MKSSKARKPLSDPHTRAKLLAAAQEVFSEKGYSGAGMRDIAALAGVSSTLLLRYFGSKAGMFEAALAAVIPAEVSFGDADRSRIGQRLTRSILNADLDLKSPSMVALAIGDPDAREATTRLTEERVIKPLAQWLGPPHAEARAMEILMVSLGFMIYTRRLPVMPQLVAPNKDIGKWFASTIQAIVDRS